MEKRQETRQPAHFTFRYHLREDPAANDLKHGKVVDRSTRGVRFETSERLPVGTMLKLVFEPLTSSDKELPHEEQGVVVWSIQPNPGEGRYRVGLKFT